LVRLLWTDAYRFTHCPRPSLCDPPAVGGRCGERRWSRYSRIYPDRRDRRDQWDRANV